MAAVPHRLGWAALPPHAQARRLQWHDERAQSGSTDWARRKEVCGRGVRGLTFELTRPERQADLARAATMIWGGAARAKAACRGGSRVERGVRHHCPLPRQRGRSP